MFQHTKPVASTEGKDEGNWAEFKLDSAPEIAVQLKLLRDRNAPVSLSSTDGASLVTAVWAVDETQNLVAFSVDENQRGLKEILAAGTAVAVAYVESVKLQFTCEQMRVSSGNQGAALQVAFPKLLLRFQRRDAYRLRIPERNPPIARLMLPGRQVAVKAKLVDLSIGGCSIHLPLDAPAVAEGATLPNVQIDLSPDLRIVTGLVVRRIFPMKDDKGVDIGKRLGVGWSKIDGQMERTLQLYIDQVQRRQRMMMGNR